jgi:hypothetical protein
MDQELIEVNCGRCGRRLSMRFDDLREKRTVQCSDLNISCMSEKALILSPTRRQVSDVPKLP